MKPKNPYARITYEEFQARANNPSLSKSEKIGFPDNYRTGHGEKILADINQKLFLDREGITVLDIGCGCDELASLIIQNAEAKKQKLLLLDSKEMLDLLPDKSCLKKIIGKFPDCYSDLESYEAKIDVIIAYSVMQHVILDSNPYSFIDRTMDLLKPGGILILGDIPNNTKRNRYFLSDAGSKAHYDYVKSDKVPLPLVNYPDTFETIDDGLLFGILLRYRGLGFESYIVPQSENLPMSNRREDILIVKR